MKNRLLIHAALASLLAGQVGAQQGVGGISRSAFGDKGWKGDSVNFAALPNDGKNVCGDKRMTLDSKTLWVWTCMISGGNLTASWQPGAVGAAGQPGTDGKTVRHGNGVPSNALGVDGDFYVDGAALAIYGPKTFGAWGSATSLRGANGNDGAPGAPGSPGAAGANGSMWYSGSGVPSSAGVNGDYYFRTATGDVSLKTSGAWSIIANLTGPPGVVAATAPLAYDVGTQSVSLSPIGNASVAVNAGIAESKLALNNPTHSSTNDPTPGQKAALLGSVGLPDSSNVYVTLSDPSNTNAREPTAHVHDAADTTSGVFPLARLPISVRIVQNNGADMAIEPRVNFTNFTGGIADVPGVSTNIAIPALALLPGRITAVQTPCFNRIVIVDSSLSAGDGLCVFNKLSDALTFVGTQTRSAINFWTVVVKPGVVAASGLGNYEELSWTIPTFTLLKGEHTVLGSAGAFLSNIVLRPTATSGSPITVGNSAAMKDLTVYYTNLTTTGNVKIIDVLQNGDIENVSVIVGNVGDGFNVDLFALEGAGNVYATNCQSARSGTATKTVNWHQFTGIGGVSIYGGRSTPGTGQVSVYENDSTSTMKLWGIRSTDGSPTYDLNRTGTGTLENYGSWYRTANGTITQEASFKNLGDTLTTAQLPLGFNPTAIQMTCSATAPFVCGVGTEGASYCNNVIHAQCYCNGTAWLPAGC